MLFTFSFVLLIGSALGTPIANVWLSPLSSVTPLRHFHSQDGSGAYQYSFTGPHHAKAESSANGITRGGYSYIDANGILQTVTYTADDENGFRVSASNLPQPPRNELPPIRDTPEVAAAKKNHLEELQRTQLRDRNWQDQHLLSYKILPNYVSFAHINPEEADNAQEASKINEIERSTKNPFLLSRAEASSIQVPQPDPSLSKATPASLVGGNAGHQLKDEGQPGNRDQLQPALMPLPALHRPIHLAAPYALPVLPYRLLHSSLRHTQDSLGQYDYTYTGDSSAKTESRSLDGTTRGAYSYIDPNGVLQQVHYIADHNGFRVLATNLPEAKR